MSSNRRNKKKFEKELRRRTYKKALKSNTASAKEIREHKTMSQTIADLSHDAMQLMGYYHEIKRFYDARIEYCKNQLEKDPSPFNQQQLDDYTKFETELQAMEASIRKVVATCADMEDMNTTSERADYFFDHMGELQDAQNQFSDTISKLTELDRKYIATKPESAEVMETPEDLFEATHTAPEGEVEDAVLTEEVKDPSAPMTKSE